MHPDEPLEHGDVTLYELLYNLRITGLGKKREAFLVYERGGGEDPFQRSVDIIKLMARFLQTDPPTKPEDLPVEFYGLKEMSGDVDRQLMIILDHKMEPIKDLFEMSEEDWGLLSRAAREKGKAEAFKKGELR